MSGVSINFGHRIGANVNIKTIDIKGFVTALRFDEQGRCYLIVWWYNGERKCEWLAGWEIE